MLEGYHTLTWFLIYCSSFASIARSLQRENNHLECAIKAVQFILKAHGDFNFKPLFNKTPSYTERESV